MYAFMRLFSLLLVAIALMLLGADAVTSLEHPGKITMRSFETIWALFNPGALAAFKGWVAATLPSFLANGVYSVLAIWAWSIGVIGVVLAFIFGRKQEE
jgi:cytochrome bd-type quinol oxidase subunit 2